MWALVDSICHDRLTRTVLEERTVEEPSILTANVYFWSGGCNAAARRRNETRRIRGGPSRSERDKTDARSLRTQQRARPVPHPPPPFQLPRREAVLDWHRDPA